MCISAYLARHNLFVDLDRLISKKGRITSSHFIDENSKGPPVHSFVVALEESETEMKKPDILKRLKAWLNFNVDKLPWIMTDDDSQKGLRHTEFETVFLLCWLYT